jgi:phosphomethylpyrimidine synthase
VRISKEISEFGSGKASGYESGNARQSAPLTAEQRAILSERGVLSPEQLQQLANKTRRALTEQRGTKPVCHSDLVTRDRAQLLQRRTEDVEEAGTLPTPGE